MPAICPCCSLNAALGYEDLGNLNATDLDHNEHSV